MFVCVSASVCVCLGGGGQSHALTFSTKTWVVVEPVQNLSYSGTYAEQACCLSRLADMWDMTQHSPAQGITDK